MNYDLFVTCIASAAVSFWIGWFSGHYRGYSAANADLADWYNHELMRAGLKVEQHGPVDPRPPFPC